MDLKERLEQFREQEYELNKEKYENLKDSQDPHTLFISCSDSRVDAETILQAAPGEVFQIRNVANIVPREEEPDTHPSVVSAVEYAVNVLKVHNVVVCGHSNCGGCAGMHHIDEYKKTLPYTSEWISQSVSIFEYIKENYPNKTNHEKQVMLEKLNAIQQLDNLLTYDFVREAYENGDINLQAYYYDIGSGIISVYDYNSEYADIIENITAKRADYIQDSGKSENETIEG